MRRALPLDRSLFLAVLLVATLSCRAASSGQERSPIHIPDSTETLRLAHAWWRAFTLGDTAYLERNTGADLVLVLSTGKSYNRTDMLHAAAAHGAQAIPVGPALDAKVLLVSPSGVVVANSIREGNSTYRYLTVLQRAGAGWGVVGAQSTRVPLIAVRVPSSVSGALRDYAGNYRGGQGGTVRIAPADSGLTLIQPNGEQLRLEPIGPGLFEAVISTTSNLTMQFLFARDDRGQVASLSRIYNGIVLTWGRIP